jgi:hypothetical protein
LSTDGILADLLVDLTPIDTPLPDTGSLRDDLDELVGRVITTVAAPVVRATLHLSAGSTDARIADAARDYWQSLLDHTAEVVRRAQRRGEATWDIDPVAAVESLLAPIYLRVLVSRQPVTATTESGVEAGVTYALEVGLLGADPTVKIEGAGLHVDVYRELLGAA